MRPEKARKQSRTWQTRIQKTKIGILRAGSEERYNPYVVPTTYIQGDDKGEVGLPPGSGK